MEDCAGGSRGSLAGRLAGEIALGIVVGGLLPGRTIEEGSQGLLARTIAEGYLRGQLAGGSSWKDFRDDLSRGLGI